MNRFILVTNLPIRGALFEKKVRKDLKKFTKRYGDTVSESIYFIKERNIDILSKLVWGDDKYYYNCEAQVDSKDFLLDIFFSKKKMMKIM